MNKIEGIVEEVVEKDGRYSIKVGGRKYSTFDKNVGEKVRPGIIVLIEFVDNKTSAGITFHNIKSLDIMRNKSVDVEVLRKYRAMCLSYAKDLALSNRIEVDKILTRAGGFFEWVMQDE